MTPVQTRAPRPIRPLFSFAASLVVALVVAVMLPVAAQAADNVAYVKDSKGDSTYYTSVSEAVSSAYGKGKTLVMLTDWGLDETLEIADSKELTIDMNGHQIKANESGSVITMREHSTLTLMSSKPNTKFTYEGYPKSGAARESMTLTSGGLITDGYGNQGGGIHMDADSHLTLNAVAVAGNYACSGSYTAGFGAGIFAKAKCTIDLKNKASIQNNNANFWGGGIYIDEGGDQTTINLDNSEITDNHAVCSGGGVLSKGKGTRISMTNGAGINNNVAEWAGGGIYFARSEFSVESSDKSGSVSGNVCKASSNFETDGVQNGGGIHVSSYSAGSGSIIKGIKVTWNRSAHDGGGLELDQERTRVVDCTIENNQAGEDGGGVFVYNDNISLENCTIRYNACDTDGKNYEGGGVFVSWHYDIKMTGMCEVVQNTRGLNSDNLDDVFLSTLSGKTGFAYITGGLSKGSTVGVRTGITGDRRIGKNINNEDKASFFIDLGGYYVSYGTDEGGDMWQRHRTREFDVTVDGERVGSYAQGAAVSVNASPDSSKVFKCWNADKSTAKIFSDTNKTSVGLSFSMPQNDVDLVADYVTRIKELKLSVDAPVAGKELPALGRLVWTDPDTGKQVEAGEVPVSWLEETDLGSVSASGAAKYGTSYVAVLSLAQDLDRNMAYALDIGASKQSIQIGESEQAAASASVDAAGRLTLTSQAYKTDKPSVVGVSSVDVTVAAGTSQADFLRMLPVVFSARTNAGTTVDLDAEADDADLSGLIKDGKVVAPDDGTATVSVPVSSEEVQLLDSQSKAEVTVTVTATTPEKLRAPQLVLSAGTYDKTDTSQSVHFDENGNLKVGVNCDATGATLCYALRKYDAASGTWSEETSAKLLGESQEILLPAAADSLATYEVEVWATPSATDEAEAISLLSSANDAAPVESDHVRGAYTVDAMTKRTVTVNYANTAIDGKPDSTPADAYSVADNGSLTVTAPEREGYVFEKWQMGERTLGTSASYTFANVLSDFEVTAVYNPVVSAFDVSFAAPVAHQELATTATVKAKFGDSQEYVDVTSVFEGSDGKAAISWSPTAGSDGKAEHMTNYVAVLKFNGDVESASGAKYVIDPNATITHNEEELVEDGGAYVSKPSNEDGLFLCFNFANTGPLENIAIASLSDVELSYEEALTYQTGQDEGYAETWGLPKGVLATSKKCGCSAFLDITWEEVSGFDKNVLAAQQFTATGKVRFPDYVDNQGEGADTISDEITVTVKVAAPKTVATPVASVKAGTYASAQTVELVCETDDVTIRYTTDGTEPTADSPKYDAPIVVSTSTTVKVRAFREGWIPSEVATFEYKIEADSDKDPGQDPGQNPKGEGGERKGDSGKGKALPQTGDAANAGLMAVVALAGIGALGLSWRLRRQNG